MKILKDNYMKNFNMVIKVLIFAAVFQLFSGLNTAKGQTKNFTGTWKLNKTKSDFSANPSFSFPYGLYNELTNDTIKVGSIVSTSDGQGYTKEQLSKYPLNGDSSVRILKNNVQLITSYVFEKKSNTVIKHQKFSSPNTETLRLIKETWTVSPNSKELMIYHLNEDLKNNKKFLLKIVLDKID